MEFSIVEFVGSGSVSAQQVGEVFRAAWSPYVALFAGEPAVARMFAGYIDATVQSEFSSRAAFERAHVAARQRFFVALDARGAVVGHVAARLGSSCELWRMAVHPQAQGRGVAKLLFTAVLRASVLSGSSLLFLTTGTIMRGARFLYESLGFTLVGSFFDPKVQNFVSRYEMPIDAKLRQRFLVEVEALKPSTWKFSKIKIQRLKRGQDSSGVRDVFVAAWAPYFDKWKDVDPGVAKICKMYVQYSLDTDLLDIASNYKRVWVARAGGRIAAMVAVTAEGELKRMAVHPQMQGHGLGRKLATKLERFVFRKLGLERVFLSTGSFMVGAPAFYKSLGYEEQRTEIFPGYTPERVFLQIVHFVKIKSLKVRL